MAHRERNVEVLLAIVLCTIYPLDRICFSDEMLVHVNRFLLPCFPDPRGPGVLVSSFTKRSLFDSESVNNNMNKNNIGDCGYRDRTPMEARAGFSGDFVAANFCP
jgi:hypothetical protein